MAERPKLIAEVLLRRRSLPPTSGSVAQALMGTPAPRPTSLYAQGLMGNDVGYGLSNYPTPPQPTLGQAFGKDAYEFASGLTAPLSALDRMGRSMLGQEGGWQGREDMMGDASTLAGLATMTPGVPATGLGMGMRLARLPESASLNTPSIPTAAQIAIKGRVESVPLSQARGTQPKMDWAKFDKGDHPPPLIKGYEDKPVAVRREDGEYLIFDGHHRTAKALSDGKSSMEMYVIDAKDFDPANAGRKPRPSKYSAEDDEILAKLFS